MTSSATRPAPAVTASAAPFGHHPNAPYLPSLAGQGANFTQSFAVTRSSTRPGLAEGLQHFFGGGARFINDRSGIPPAKVDLGLLDAAAIAAFPDHIERERGARRRCATPASAPARPLLTLVMTWWNASPRCGHCLPVRW